MKRLLLTGVLTASILWGQSEEDPGLQRQAAEYYSGKYGVSQEEASRRIALQDRASGIEDVLGEVLGREFAGVWYDHGDRGRLKIGLTQIGSRYRADVQRVVSSLGVEADADMVPVTFSLASLTATQDAARQELMNLVMAGKAKTGYNTRLNRVIVGVVMGLSREDEARVSRVAALAGVSVQRAPFADFKGQPLSCQVRRCDAPMRGGREIVSSIGSLCTAGFMARHRVTTSHKLVLTAGHCIFGGNEASLWSARDEAGFNYNIGPSYGYSYAGGPGVDAGAIYVDPGNYWGYQTPMAAVVVKASDDTTYNPTYSIGNDSLSSIGQILCKTGRTTFTKCSEVVELGIDNVYNINGQNYLLKNLGELDDCVSQGGDSGGPIYKNHKAYGMLVGSNVGFNGWSCNETYQGIRGAQNVLNVSLLLAP